MKRDEDSPLSSNKAIKSARIVATARALGFYDKGAQNPDFMAKYFLSLKFKTILWYLRGVQKILGSGFLERPAPGFYWYFQVRTKHIDSILMESISAGIEQFVILGAGYDSRPYRFKEKLTGIRTFEVDFPGTLSSKKQQLIKLYGSLPEHVTYVQIDFNSQLIKDALLEKGYDPNKKTFFIWEGVTYYLPEKSVNAVLEFITQNSQSDSLVVFDYALRSFIEGDYSTYGSKKLAEGWKKMGEPGLSGIEDGKTSSILREKGLNVISDLGPEELESIYLSTKNGKQIGRIWGCMRIVYASING
jgi:methyltransferase (TIGR00027 family)